MNDTVCCEVLKIIPDTDKMVFSMKGIMRKPDDPPPNPPLGLLSLDELPLPYKYVLLTILSNNVATLILSLLSVNL